MFSRTPSGIRNTDLFYRGYYIVMVEGEYDVIFWRKFFPKEVSGYKLKLKSVGGKEEIKKYIDEINKGYGKFAVALDSDYNLFMNKIHNHVQIVETFVHSIENIIIKPHILEKIISDNNPNCEDYDIQNIESWLEYFDKTMYDLMIADYLIERDCLSQECLGNNCSRFFPTPKTKVPEFDELKIYDFINKLNLPEHELTILKEELKHYKPCQHIRGHFFFSASLYFVNDEIKKFGAKTRKKQISNEGFYRLLFLSIEYSIPDFPDLHKLQEKAVRAAEKVVELLSNC
jgi:hypothetical protein